MPAGKEIQHIIWFDLENMVFPSFFFFFLAEDNKQALYKQPHKIKESKEKSYLKTKSKNNFKV